MKLEYMVVDVFTSTRFGGNPLAVVFDADDLTTEQMQTVAREFNFSETSFVLTPKDANNTAHVRIFTASIEMPFAGHPNVGTAYALATRNEHHVEEMLFEEKAGLVSVRIAYDGDALSHTSIVAPLPLSVLQSLTCEEIAAVLSLHEADIITLTHPPQIASVGAEFIIVEVENRDCLKKIRFDFSAAERLNVPPSCDAIYVYTRDTDTVIADTDVERDWTARMFAFEEIPYEDPATGSASGAAVALVASLGVAPKNGDVYCLSQGVDMGRPSELYVRMLGEGVNARAEISGKTVTVMQGEIEI
ncbi:PhzF family phenazine biosynthesis protein [Lentilitoribacter sp. Alg239-R112]|jgi:trans-2,3-dihydro-3-hydroxyanthranilate isomerase|uniref:PhzF family phenazine biosynthesis protein n=1 Tax=Lentilitoribacter sp. Alg239-R112 TaxID=2305987 RepID=UPI0013A6B85B|nr:PhzF family phenazine biosynthesis protein [Lentilitoribacter sp. Alg239-R112]